MYILSFIKNFQSHFQSACTNLHSQEKCTKFPTSLPLLLILTIILRCSGYRNEVLISISWNTNDLIYIYMDINREIQIDIDIDRYIYIDDT